MNIKKILKMIYILMICAFLVSFSLSGCASSALSDTSKVSAQPATSAQEKISGFGDTLSDTSSEAEISAISKQISIEGSLETGADNSSSSSTSSNSFVSSFDDSSASTSTAKVSSSNNSSDPDQTDSSQGLSEEGASETVIYIEQNTEEETESVIRMGVDSSLLPVLEGVTTAADNAELAPVNLRLGDQYSVVEVLQTRLMALGYMDNDETTTYYGSSTAEAVKLFQRQMDMDEDGICGTETWDALFSDTAPHYAVCLGDEGDDIQRIQERLYELGYLAYENVDGHFGPATETAVKNMQERNGITVDGTVGQESTNLLYSDEVQANVLSRGDQSDLVGQYQQRLIALGYLRNEEADGAFGAATENAVREFQSRNDLIVDGYLGPGTVSALMSETAKPFGLRVGDESDTVTSVQERLVHYGYLASRHVTGYYGTLTEAAVKQFQSQNGLSSDGVVGTQTMALLESSDAKSRPQSVPSVSSGSGDTGGSSASSGDGSSGQSGAGSGTTASVGSSGATVSGAASTLVSIAMSKLGSPYVYGAKGPNSFDCSGFVYWCLNQAGVSQSYLTSSGWRNPGRYQRISSIDSLQAGDIIVVSGHVGICAGGGTVVDASSSNGRVVHRQITSWWRNNFIVGWRIFG